MQTNNSLTASLFHSYFVRETTFCSGNIQYAYNFYGNDLHENVCRGVFRTQSDIYGGAYLQKSRKASLQMFDWVPNMPLI